VGGAPSEDSRVSERGNPDADEAVPDIGFAADVRATARALARHPAVPLVSIVLALLQDVVPSGRDHSGAGFVTIPLFLVMLGWYGVERVFFLRQFRGRPATLTQLLSLVRFFVGRFLVLGLLVGTVFLTSFFALARLFGTDMDRLSEGSVPPIWFGLCTTAVVLWIDFGLTFVTSALAYTTRSVFRALDIGLGMIARTWPRSVLYVLCPPLALNILNWIFPVGGLGLQLPITCLVTVVALIAKGAIAAFYLRERGSYAEDGAAYRVGMPAHPEVLTPA